MDWFSDEAQKELKNDLKKMSFPYPESERIKFLYFRGLGRRATARILNLDVNTVRDHLISEGLGEPVTRRGRPRKKECMICRGPKDPQALICEKCRSEIPPRNHPLDKLAASEDDMRRIVDDWGK